MPCYSVSTISVVFSPSRIDLLERAADAIGARLSRNSDGTITVLTADGVEVRIADGQATVRDERVAAQEAVNSLRVAYSSQVVAEAKKWAAQKGWRAQNVGNGKVQLSKGR